MLVAGSSQLAAFSVGGVVGYPNVLLEQLKSNESSIQVDLDTYTWIGSVHGLAGIPSIFMPTVMQWKGRRLAFIMSSLFIITGWILTLVARNVTTILIAEAIHGLGVNSIVTVCYYTMSEMTDPRFRLFSMTIYPLIQSLAIAVVGTMGKYLHWKIVGCIMGIPSIISLAWRVICPESPSWLAYKGKFEKCQHSFVWLRGTSEESRQELSILISVHKERRNHHLGNSKIKKSLLRRLTSRDFYIPCFQTLVFISLFYNSGTIIFLIYGMDMIRKTTNNASAAFYGMISIQFSHFLGILFNVFLLKSFNNKPVFLCSGFISALFLLLATTVNYLQYIHVLPEDTLLCLYFLIGFMICSSSGMAPMCVTVPAELMPVQHRDMGGAVYVTSTCLLHFISLKVAPYLLMYLQLWGTLLLFTLYTICSLLFIWKYVPETKNRTLHEIEDFYTNGRFTERVECEDENSKIVDNE